MCKDIRPTIYIPDNESKQPPPAWDPNRAFALLKVHVKGLGLGTPIYDANHRLPSSPPGYRLVDREVGSRGATTMNVPCEPKEADRILTCSARGYSEDGKPWYIISKIPVRKTEVYATPRSFSS